MTTDRLPARRRPSPHSKPLTPAEWDAYQVLVGEVLDARSATATRMIRGTEWARLGRDQHGRDQVVLDGPLGEVGQIVAILRGRGELSACTPATPSMRGAMVTATLIPPAVPGRVRLGKAPTVRPWTPRRKAIVFGGVLPGLTVAVLVVALLWPLAAAGTGVALFLMGYLWREYGRRHHNGNVPHVAIDHVDGR